MGRGAWLPGAQIAAGRVLGWPQVQALLPHPSRLSHFWLHVQHMTPPLSNSTRPTLNVRSWAQQENKKATGTLSGRVYSKPVCIPGAEKGMGTAGGLCLPTGLLAPSERESSPAPGAELSSGHTTRPVQLALPGPSKLHGTHPPVGSKGKSGARRGLLSVHSRV